MFSPGHVALPRAFFIMTKKIIKIAEINLEQSPLPRAHIDKGVVADYADTYQAGAKMPPLVVFDTNDTGQENRYLLADGRHRLMAMKLLKKDQCVAEVITGNSEACLTFALSANTTHGHRRTNEDKRKCILLALGEWPNKSSREIGKVVGVSHQLVCNIVNEQKQSAVNIDTPEVVSGSESKPQPTPAKEEKPLTEPVGTKPAAHHPVDVMGYPIPPKVVEYFNRGRELKKLVNEIHGIARIITDAADRRDVLWRGFNFQDAEIALGRLTENLRAALPEVVCTQCAGHPELNANGGCPLCHGKGLISLYWFREKGLIPQEIRTLREKAIESYQKK